MVEHLDVMAMPMKLLEPRIVRLSTSLDSCFFVPMHGIVVLDLLWRAVVRLDV